MSNDETGAIITSLTGLHAKVDANKDEIGEVKTRLSAVETSVKQNGDYMTIVGKKVPKILVYIVALLIALAMFAEVRYPGYIARAAAGIRVLYEDADTANAGSPKE